MIINDDCLNIFPKIKDKSVDLILTDPPYGVTANKWDSVIDLELMFDNLNRIIKDNGTIVLTSIQPFTTALIQANIKYFRYCLVWEKNIATGYLNAKIAPLKIHEDICVFYKNKNIYNPIMRTGFKPYKCEGGTFSKNYGKQRKVINVSNGDRYPNSILKFDTEKGYHPTQKPVKLMEYLINTYSNKNDKVLDFTMGSGTTGVACYLNNRKFLGIEKDKKYFKIAKSRIKEAKKQRGLMIFK